MSAPPRPRAFRVAASLGLTVLLLVSAEGILRLVRGPVAPPPLVRQMWDPGQAPFSESAGVVEPVFQGRDSAGTFPAVPAAGAPRVMVFGESSVRGGSGLAVSQEFPALLHERLTQAGHPTEVLNLGRVGMDSHSIRELVPAATAYRPAAAVLYYGHNDIGNAFFLARYSSVSSAATAHARAFFQRFQLYATLRDLVLPAPKSANEEERAPASALPNPTQRALAVSEYKANLEIAVRSLQDAGAAVVLVTPISRDGVYETMEASCPQSIPPAAWTSGRGGWTLHPEQLSLSIGEAAVAAAPTCPEALYVRGWWRQLAGDVQGGWADLRAARELDPRPLRASADIVAAMRSVAARTGATLVDLEAQNALVAASRTDDWFVDPVHPSAAGHQHLAIQIAPALATALGN